MVNGEYSTSFIEINDYLNRNRLGIPIGKGIYIDNDII